jgi:hypothetical protein
MPLFLWNLLLRRREITQEKAETEKECDHLRSDHDDFGRRIRRDTQTSYGAQNNETDI